MKKTLTILFTACCALLSAGSAALAQQVHPHYVDGQIYLRTQRLPLLEGEKGIADPEKAPFLSPEMISRFGIHKLEKPFWRAKSIDIQTIYRLHFSAQTEVYELIRALEQQACIEYAEQVPLYKTTLTPNDLGANNTNGGQWHLWKIQAQQAWDISVGNANITVAIVDDAIKRDHPDLAPSIWTNTGEIANNGIDDDNNGYVDDRNGYDVADDDPDVLPNTNGMSHGTHVSGISGAATNNGTGVASIGFGIKIIPVKSSNQEEVITDGYTGIIYAADVGARVINMSWGGSGGGQTGQNVINYAANAGCILVAAAGNDDVNTPFYPANYNNVISVASTTTTDGKSSFSNYGSWIDVSAPGSAIRSTYISSSGQNTYANLQGTSMASPLVAGLCGLMLSHNPNMTRAQLETCLYSSTDPVTSNIGEMGAGRINAYKALQCVAQSAAAPPISQISSDIQTGCAGATIQFTGNSSGGAATSYQWSFPGGTPATSTLQNPVVTYNANGSYSVTLTTSNQYGSNTSTQTNYITISNAATQVFYFEDFETANPNLGVLNPDNAVTWAITTTAGNLTGTRSAYMNFYNYNAPGQRDGLITPSIDFSQHVAAQLDFTHAYRRYNTNSSDSLIIKVSTNNGATWQRIWQAGENGTGSFATQTTSTNAFTPAVAADWCLGGNVGANCFSVPLTQFDGQPNVRIMFEGFNNYGNNLYIDDIKVSGICNTTLPAAPQPSFNASSNNICQGQTVNFTNTTTNATSYQWTFQGGTPATSTVNSPTVTYNNVGIFNVTLTATGPGGTITQTFNSAVTVNALPNAVISNSGGTLTASPAGMIYQWYLNGSPVSGATQQTFTPSSNGSYTVVITNPANCSKESNAIVIQNLSLEDVSAQFEWNVYPNPASGTTTVSWKDNGFVQADIRVIDAFGKEVRRVPSASASGVQVDLDGLASGMYFIGIRFEGQRELLKKIIVK